MSERKFNPPGVSSVIRVGSNGNFALPSGRGLVSTAVRAFVISQSGLERANPPQFDEPPAWTPDEPIKQSVLGTPIWTNLKFPAGNYQTLDGEIIEFDGLEIDSVLITVSQSKNIVTTAIQGRNGTVKEYISDGDYMVQISGALVGAQADVFPEADFADLIEILKAPVSIKVESEFFNFFDIFELAVTGYETPQTAGFRNMQYFSISALSDAPIELKEI
jgi:hypothetical protein